MSDTRFSIGRIFIQIALGAMLLVGGIWALQGGGDVGISAIRSMVQDSSMESILRISFGVVELIAGLFLIIALFIGDRLGLFGRILMIIIMIVWIAAIVLSDFLGAGGLLKHGNAWNFLKWLYDFAYHLIVLGAIILLQF